MMEERKRKHGLCECILGRRPDMCPLPDFNGKDENAAGTDYGAIGMFRSCFGSNRCISVCHIIYHTVAIISIVCGIVTIILVICVILIVCVILIGLSLIHI